MVLTQRVLRFMDYQLLFPTPTLKILWTVSLVHMASEGGRRKFKMHFIFRQTPASQKIFDFVLANIGEGAESLAGGIIRQALKNLYNRKDSIENISEIDIQQTFHNALVDVFISSFKNLKKGS